MVADDQDEGKQNSVPVKVGTSDRTSDVAAKTAKAPDGESKIWTVLRLIVTAVAAVVAAVALVFPFGVRAYADRAVASTPDGGVLQPAVDVLDDVQKIDDLGARTLPLLNDDSRASVEQNNVDKLNEVGNAVFGDQWSNIVWQAGKYASAYGFGSAITSDNPGTGEHYNLSQTRSLVKAALDGLGSDSEAQVVQIMGLATLFGDANYYQGDPSLLVVAAALAFEAPAKYNTCDVLTQSAGILSIYGNGQGAEDMFDKAIAACKPAGDATPAVAQVYFRLGNSSGMCTAQASISYFAKVRDGSFTEVSDTLTKLMRDYPKSPAAQIAAGNVYANMASEAKTAGYGAFQIKALRQQELLAFQTAAKLTTDPVAVEALARGYNDLGQYDQTVKLLEGASNLSDNAYALYAQALGHEGRFDQAVEQQAAYLKGFKDAQTTAKTAFVENYDETNIVMTLPGNVGVPHWTTIKPCGAGAGVEDFTITPEFRDDSFGLQSGEHSAVIDSLGMGVDLESSQLASSSRQELYNGITTYVQLTLLAGHKDQAASLCANNTYQSELCATLLGGDNLNAKASTSYGSTQARASDGLQNLWRQYGQYDQAQQTLENAKSAGDDPLIEERLGEVLFLKGEYQQSAEASERAVAGYQQSGVTASDPSNVMLKSGQYTGSEYAQLRVASALRQAQDLQGAEQAAQKASEIVNSQSSYGSSYDSYDASGNGEAQEVKRQATISYITLEQAQIAYAQKDYQKAATLASQSVEQREAANEQNKKLSFVDVVQMQRGAAEQLASVASYGAGDYQAALDWAKKAVEGDPMSPLYNEAVADAERQQSGTFSPEDVANAYKLALRFNDSLFSSWNNLGVLQYESSDANSAIESLKQAVKQKPDYAIGWFNLGVVASEQPGLNNFMLAQGAFGKASQIDSSYKDADRETTFDDEVYQSGLDVSKAIPDDWKLGRTVKTGVDMFTIGLALLVVVRVLISLGQDWISGKVTDKAIPFLEKTGARVSGGRPNPVARVLLSPWLTTVVTLVALMWMSGANAGLEWWMTLLGCVLLLAIPVVVTSWVGAGAKPDRHQSFWPASVVTVALAPFGLGFAPPAPIVVDDENLARRKERWSMLLLGLFTVAVCVAGAVTGVPATRLLSAAALVVIGSALTAIPPLDGAKLDPPAWLDWLITALLTASTVLSAMGLL